ncbi:hypothetical protein T265_08297 [Opisthorchis viverrini]|uniref:Uncharacterized protein n=1 Tax=Opisthorchis viverrini TaxID=6198 RepID=A0A074Z9Z2_OPIVI|nr:hypothetical protein T265_08297 [Opisthorchis viverrini]KER23938.1 hypothetical protein T265_08297 [Opisthorchis viverrini]
MHRRDNLIKKPFCRDETFGAVSLRCFSSLREEVAAVRWANLRLHGWAFPVLSQENVEYGSTNFGDRRVNERKRGWAVMKRRYTMRKSPEIIGKVIRSDY